MESTCSVLRMEKHMFLILMVGVPLRVRAIIINEQVFFLTFPPPPPPPVFSLICSHFFLFNFREIYSIQIFKLSTPKSNQPRFLNISFCLISSKSKVFFFSFLSVLDLFQAFPTLITGHLFMREATNNKRK